MPKITKKMYIEKMWKLIEKMRKAHDDVVGIQEKIIIVQDARITGLQEELKEALEQIDVFLKLKEVRPV